MPYNGGLGSIFITGLTSLGSNQYLPSVEYSNTYQFTDNVTKNLGRHSIKVGFEFQHLRFSILQPPSGRGAWNFSGDYTEVPTTNGGNTGLAQMLLTPIPGTVPGAADYVGGADNIQASNIANTDMHRSYYGTYFQDDFKVSPKLTVNLGLRWEYFGQLIEQLWCAVQFPSLRKQQPLRVPDDQTALQHAALTRFLTLRQQPTTSSLCARDSSGLGTFPTHQFLASRRIRLSIYSESWWPAAGMEFSMAASRIRRC